MIKLNTEPTSQDTDTDAPSTSAGVMFTTILLLIGGLLLTSAMFIHYGFGGTDENGESISGLTRAWERAKSTPASPPVNSESNETVAAAPHPANAPATTTQPDAVVKSSGFSLKDIFSKNSNGSVRWPRLKLAGFGRPSDGEIGFAIINGKHVVEGSTISGVTLVEILEHGAVVEYKGETKTLIVEMTH